MKHTPGPWGVPDSGTSSGSVLISQGSPAGWTGAIAWADAGNYARGQQEGLANAHLIAAAPDLAALVERYLRLEEEAAPYSSSPLREESRAILRKAGRLA